MLVLVSLVGGRPLPNIELILNLKPDKLYFIVSQDSTGKNSNFDKLIRALPDSLRNNLIPKDSSIVKPYVIQETFDVCSEIIGKYHDADDKIIINIASEPKTMSFGAYQAAYQAIQDNNNIQLLYSSRDGLVDLFSTDSVPRPIEISIIDYFAAYGWNVEISTTIEENKRHAVKLFVENLRTFTELLNILRQRDKGKGKRTIHVPSTFSDSQYKLLKKMCELDLLANLTTENQRTSYTIPKEDDWIFLNGKWFEYYVYNTAINLQVNSRPLFDECAWNVEDMIEGERKGKGEIDFVGIYQGQLVIASCKTESRIKAHHLNQLSTRAEQLGKGMCTKIFISTVFPTEDQKQEVEKWAKERAIITVFGDDLPKLGAIITEATRKPMYSRI